MSRQRIAAIRSRYLKQACTEPFNHEDLSDYGMLIQVDVPWLLAELEYNSSDQVSAKDQPMAIGILIDKANLLTARSPRLNPLQRLRGFVVGLVNPNYSPCTHGVTGTQSPHELVSGFNRLVVLLKEFVDFDNSHLERSAVCGACGKVALDFGRAKRSRLGRVRSVHRILVINDPAISSWQDLSGHVLDDYQDCDLFILNGVVQKHRNGPVGYSVREEVQL